MREPRLAAQHNSSRSQTMIEYRRLRSPRENGDTLQIPPLGEFGRLWKKNRELRHDTERSRTSIGDVTLAELQNLGRRELIALASAYTRRYCDVQVATSSDAIILSGHQPELFHAGVWFKNFALSELGRRWSATPINLVIDNDVCGSTSIRYPNRSGDHVRVSTIPIVRPGPSIPYETRKVDDLVFFRAFRDRVLAALPSISDPVINRLWPNVLDSAEQLWSKNQMLMGPSIAAGRHRLESEFGLQTLEVPISQVAQTEAFARFTKSIFISMTTFRESYNDALTHYRQTHRIRSRSHPVPELETLDDWIEAPFWVWQADQPRRQRLFARIDSQSIELSDQAGWQVNLEAKNFVQQFRELAMSGVAIRPKALITTMFSRLVLSDAFLHGIGGAKYDQLTDNIMQRFFAVRPPGFVTLSATFKLPSNAPISRRRDLMRSRQLIRELRFHPEKHIANPSGKVSELISQKRRWTHGQPELNRTKQKHDAITSLNQQLSHHLNVSLEQASADETRLQDNLRASEILDSREYSFCLFPETLLRELRACAHA